MDCHLLLTAWVTLSVDSCTLAIASTVACCTCWWLGQMMRVYLAWWTGSALSGPG